MAQTLIDLDQLRFVSSKTGITNLDAYLEAAEIGSKTLGTLLASIFKSADGAPNVPVFNGSGNIGFGTASPAVRAHAYGASNGASLELLRLTNAGAGASTRAKLGFEAAGTLYAEISGGYGASVPEMLFTLPSVSAGNFVWSSAGTEYARLDSSARFGLGTATPDRRFVVNGDIGLAYTNGTSQNGFRRSGTKTQYFNSITSTTADVIHEFLGSGDVVKAALTEGGNFGVGTATPANRFHVADATAGNGFEVAPGATITLMAFNRTSATYLDWIQRGASHQFLIGTTERMRLDPTGSLLVGQAVNDATYAYKACINGGTYGARLSASGGVNALTYPLDIYANASATAGARVRFGTGANVFDNHSYIEAYTLSATTSDLRFGTSGLERGRFDSAGSLNLGTTLPYVAGMTANTPRLRVAALDSSNAAILARGAGASAGGAGMLVLQKTRSTAADTLATTLSGDVLGAVSAEGVNANGTPAIAAAAAIQFYQDGNAGATYVPGRIAFLTSDGSAGWTERARIDGAGKLLLGATTAVDRLTVGPNSVATNPAAEWGIYSGTAGQTSYAFTANVTYGLAMSVKYRDAQVGSISCTTTTTTYATSSDYRLKHVDGPLTGSGAFIDALQPKQGHWLADGSPFVGFLAHEFQEVSPSSVTGTKDAVDASGAPVYQAMQASSPEVMANVIAQLQELRSRVAALEAAPTIH